MERLIDEGRWEDFLNVYPIRPGDFFQIPPGTVHAIRKGTLLIEVQQNSDITYRLYDYGRQPGGKPRELHIKQGKDVIRCPYTEEAAEKKVFHEEGYDRTFFVSCRFYTVEKYDIRGTLLLKQDHPFLIVSVTGGEGSMDGLPVKKGDCLILPWGYGAAKLEGDLSLVTAHV